MATGAESPVFQPSADASATDIPLQTGTTNLFEPVSTHNRITGTSRGGHRHTPTQLTPGSSYDYGRNEYLEGAQRTDAGATDLDPLAFQRGIPPTFLRRTMVNPATVNTADVSASAGWNDASPTMIYNAAAIRQQRDAFPPAVQQPNGRQTVVSGAPARESRGWKPVPRVPPAQEVYGWKKKSVSYAAAPEAPTDAPSWGGANVRAPAWDAPGHASETSPASPAPARQPLTAPTPAQAWQPSPMPAPASAPMAVPVPASMPAPAQAQARPSAAEAETPSERPSSRGAAGVRVSRRDYTPKHGRQAESPTVADALPPVMAPVQHMPDTWELMGWKAADDMQNTAVMHIRDLTMFERGAFEEPPSPYSMPMEPNMPDRVPAIGAYGDAGPVSGSGSSFGADNAAGGYYGAPGAAGYAPYDPQALEGYPAQPGNNPAYPYGAGAPYGEAPYREATHGTEAAPYGEVPGGAQDARSGDPALRSPAPHRRAAPAGQGGTPAHSPARTPAHQPAHPPAHPPAHRAAPRKQRLSLAAMGPWRVGLLIVSLLALLFCVIEVGQIVHAMLLNEQQMKQYREGDWNGGTAVSGVDLLPAGVTFAPTATKAPVYTPTPTPIIDQNDPLIGVMDGGATASQYQSVLPTPTPATRTRLTQYPDNALLSTDAAFTDLLAENPDVVGQLTIDGVLDETVVQRNNTFYLNHNARGVQGSNGALFVDESCVLRQPPENLLIRGQITPEGRLFSSLSQYGTQGAEFVRQHGIVTCNTLFEKARYAVFAVIHADSRTNSADYFNYASYPTFQSDAQMLRYVEAARQHSVYSIDVGVNASDRLLTLATLAEGSDTTCWVVICRMLRNGETDGNIQRQ